MRSERRMAIQDALEAATRFNGQAIFHASPARELLEYIAGLEKKATELEQAARNLIGLARWQHPEYGDWKAPFPWRCETDDHIVTILASDGQVLISDNSWECDPAFWTAFISTLNGLAEIVNTSKETTDAT